VVEEFYLHGKTYEQIGKTQGLSVKDVENYLVSARKKIFQIISDILAETVDSEEDLRKELQELFG
jgi:DNA-directed RNA polymerase specialized sigma24 family protein